MPGLRWRFDQIDRIMVACTMQLQVIGLLCLPSNLVFAAHALGSVASKQTQALKTRRGV